MVEDGTSGLLVPPDDVEALKTAMARLVNEPERARSLGSTGRRETVSRFDTEKVCAEADHFYRTLVPGGAHATR
jgi:glycosyltransferase involved in cell wall biosynthesis